MDFQDIQDELFSKKESDKPGDVNLGPQTFLFIPTEGKDMKTEYPELGMVPEFNMLSNRELTFVWLMGNRTSPLIDEPDRPKAWQEALKISGLTKTLPDSELRNFRVGNFPSKINSAINRMAMYVPSIRMRTKLMNEKMLKNLESLVDLSEEQKAVMSLSDKKSYAEFVKTVTNEMDDLIVNLENAYGIKQMKRKKGDNAPSERTLMDKVLARQ